MGQSQLAVKIKLAFSYSIHIFLSISKFIIIIFFLEANDFHNRDPLTWHTINALPSPELLLVHHTVGWSKLECYGCLEAPQSPPVDCSPG